MYTATMHYRFKPESFDAACALWQSHVMAAARAQEGFVRMQFLVAPPEALAIGTWRDKAYAEQFMRTGVFSRLMAELEAHCTENPKPTIWDLRYFDTI